MDQTEPSAVPEAKSPSDGVRIVGRIGTDPEKLARIADSVVDWSETIKDMEIDDLRALVKAVQNHPRVILAPEWKKGDPVPRNETLKDVTIFRISGGRVMSAQCDGMSVRVSFYASCRFAGEAKFKWSKFVGGASFESASFAGAALFDGASVVGEAKFDRVGFAGAASFDGASLVGEASFERTRFARAASFERASFAGGVSFKGASFAERASFAGMRIAGTASFERVSFADRALFREAGFTGAASFDGAGFARGMTLPWERGWRKAQFDGVSFAAGVSFGGADVGGIDFSYANLHRWSLDDVRNMRLDGNDLKDVRFPPNTSEAWHSVRRAYTGTKFFFHLILLTAFLGGYAARVMMWVGVNHAQVAIVDAADRVEKAANAAADKIKMAGERDAAKVEAVSEAAGTKIETEAKAAADELRAVARAAAEKLRPTAPNEAARLETAGRIAAEKIESVGRGAATKLDELGKSAAEKGAEAATVVAEAAREVSHMKQSLTPETREYEVWQVLLGLDRGWSAFALAMALIVYNVLRAWLTHDVGAMRDESDRSGFAPYWKDYKRAWYVHTYFMRWLMLVAILSFVWHAWGWLRSPVWLPG